MSHYTFSLPLLPAADRRVLYGLVLSALSFLLLSAPVLAASTPAIAQSFNIDRSDIAAGALVSTKPHSQNTVELSNQERAGDLVGIVAEKPLVALGDDERSVQVVTSGIAMALVSDINGDINAGDKITASPIEGVGMKVTEPATIVGTAQVDLSSMEAKSRSIRDRDGNLQTVRVGQIPVEVRVAFHTPNKTQVGFLPEVLQNSANSIAGKPVSPIRVIISTLLLFLALISVMVLTYSSVRSSIISIGRNPLSEKAVHRSLFEVATMSLGILLVTFITVYLILVI